MTTRNSEGTGLSSCVGEGSDNPALWDPVQCRFSVVIPALISPGNQRRVYSRNVTVWTIKL